MIRVGAVNYLNTKPLIEGLVQFAPTIDLRLDLPSRLADQLNRGELDVGLIPVVELFRAGTYSFIPDCGITSFGPVLSVTLFSRVPWDEIRSVSLDEGSRTSAALTKVLLAKRNLTPPAPLPWEGRGENETPPLPLGEGVGGRGLVPITYRSLPIDVPADDVSTDAVLLIGDRAMKACLPGFEFSYDLGQKWTEHTGLPMVWAVWAVRAGVDLGEAEFAFARAKRNGQSRAGAIAARESAKLGLDPGYCRRYFDTIIRYDLGEAELAGLNRYAQLTAELGLAPEGVRLVHYHRPNLVPSR